MALNRHTAAAALLLTVGLLLAGIGTLAVATPAQSTPAHSTAGGLGDLHAAGYTGENVSIGVLDVTGFDRSAPAVADQVAAARAFGPGATVAQGGHSEHGTAAATVAAETAPDADLYLATFESQGGYQRAVQWLLANDVDVIVAPVSFYGTPGDGSTRVSQVATDAVRQDVVFVAAAGNLANGHWRTRYDSVEDGTLVVDGNRRNYLGGEGGHVTLWLSWDEAHADQEYTVELYRETNATTGTDTGATRAVTDHATDGGRTTDDARTTAGDSTTDRTASAELVARSQAFTRDEVPNQRLEADVRGGRYFVVVRGPDGATGARLRLTSPTHEFQRPTPRGSLAAPATAEGVLTVGAFDPVADRVEPFSSRGPTLDDRRGIDVVAPARHDVVEGNDPYVGTSAAAPYAGGVVALLRQADPGGSPSSLEHALEATAIDVARPGPDLVAGYGRIDPYRAVRALANETADASP